MSLVQKDAFRTMIISYIGIVIGYLNKGLLFLLIFSTEEIGLINLILSVGFLFAQLANLGTVYTTWRFLPFFKNSETKHNGFLSMIFGVVLVGIALCIIGSVLFRAQIEEMYMERSSMFVDYYIWVLPIGISYALYMVLDAYLRGFYKNIVSVIALDLVLRVAVMILLFLVWLNIITFNSFVIMHSLVYFILPIMLITYLAHIKELNFSVSSIRIPKRFRKILLQFTLFNYVNTLGAVLVNSLDVMMIAYFIGLDATGVYATVVFLTSAVQVPFRSITRVSSPLIADYWKHRQMDEMKELYRDVSSVSLVIGLSAFLWIWLNIDFLFSFLRPEFQAGIWVFFFLMMGRLLDMFFGLNGAIFTTSKKYKYDIYFTLLLIVGVYSLNLALIPIWGIAGAAISTAIALIVYNIGRILFVWYAYKIHPFHKNQFIIIGIGIVTLFVGEFIGAYFINKWMRLVFETILFGTVFILPIYILELEPKTVNYIKKGSQFVMSKLGFKLS